MMQKPFEISVTVPEHWNFIGPTCSYVANLLGCFFKDQELFSRAEIVTDELLGNIVKYCDWQNGTKPLFNFAITADQKSIIFESANPVRPGDGHGEEVQETLSLLRDTNHPDDVYVERLMQQEDRPRGSSQAGLMRIVVEGLCTLEASIDRAAILHIKATMGVAETMNL